MDSFEFVQPRDVAEALRLSQTPNARLLAGGTTLIDLMKLHVERPSTVIDIQGLPFAAITELAGGVVRVGAMVRNADMAQHPLIRDRYPVLSEALMAGASPQLRNMATTGGNLLQRTRCYYFRDTSMPCNKREPGSGCAAIHGYNRIHAVLGGSDHCIATHPSDLCVALAALETTVRVQSPAGERTIPFANFHVLPELHPEHETTLRPGELITAIDIAPMRFASRSAYVKVRDRASYAFALSSAAVALEIADGVIHTARIALGGVATKPWRATEAERVLAGRKADVAAFTAAAEAALHGAVGRGHNDFKIKLAKRTLVRALTIAASRS